MRKIKNVRLVSFSNCVGGLIFVGMQAYEWSKLIHEGVRPWENPLVLHNLVHTFFMITGFHGTRINWSYIFIYICL